MFSCCLKIVLWYENLKIFLLSRGLSHEYWNMNFDQLKPHKEFYKHKPNFQVYIHDATTKMLFVVMLLNWQ